MNRPDRDDQSSATNNSENNRSEFLHQPQEKTTLGGDFNSGVTSNDAMEKEEIEKKGGMANIDQSRVRTEEERNAENQRS